MIKSITPHVVQDLHHQLPQPTKVPEDCSNLLRWSIYGTLYSSYIQCLQVALQDPLGQKRLHQVGEIAHQDCLKCSVPLMMRIINLRILFETQDSRKLRGALNVKLLRLQRTALGTELLLLQSLLLGGPRYF